ncbi:MAG: hypothetical protein BroJett011_03840 [Chloroflexota bacterium]|nr:MAG: hypothetical protein BroJett011_03840 [Chloroflexota bacterium]
MPKPTAKALRGIAEELLSLRSAVERYEVLEKELKAGLAELKWKEIDLPTGRVFISLSERFTIPPEAAVAVLGELQASKVIVTRKTVSNEILGAFVKAGEISQANYEKLLAQAQRAPVTSLHVRPLK